MTFDATPASPEATSFISVAEADAYFVTHPSSSDWDGTTDAKEDALIFSTNILNSLSFHGFKFNQKQKLKLPAVGYTSRQMVIIQSLTSQLIFTINNISDRNNYSETYWLYAGLEMLTGDAQYQHRLVTDYNITTGQITIAPAFDNTIAEGNKAIITQEVPEPVKWATAELAFEYINSNNPLDFDPRVTEYRVGDVSEKFGVTKDGLYTLPPKVMTLINPFLNRMEHGSF